MNCNLLQLNGASFFKYRNQNSFKIDVRIIGEEYKTIDFTGKKYCTEKGIEIHYNSREHRFSSTEIKTRLKK